MRVVEVGQYFVTKDTGDFRQFQSVACREYTLPRDDRASQPKGWIQGNMRIGPVLEVTTSFQHFKYGIEIRIESVNKDSSHSWVRISYGRVKYVIDSVEDEKSEIPADPQEEQTPPTSTNVVAAWSKAKQNLTRGNLLAQQRYHYVKEDGLTLSHQSKISIRMISRRKSSIFFDIIRRYIEKKMEKRSSTDEMYFLFSEVSSFIRCPHVQYAIPALQCVKHVLHCDFGSTSIISHSSVFPAAIIASFDSLLKGLNARCC